MKKQYYFNFFFIIMNNNKKWFITITSIVITTIILAVVWISMNYVTDFTEWQRNYENVSNYIEEDLNNLRKLLYRDRNYVRKDFVYHEAANVLIKTTWNSSVYRKSVDIIREPDPSIWEWFRITATYSMSEWIERTYYLYELRNYYDLVDWTPKCNLNTTSPIPNWDDAVITWDSLNLESLSIVNKTKHSRFISNALNWSHIISADDITQNWNTVILLSWNWIETTKLEDWTISEREIEVTCNTVIVSE